MSQPPPPADDVYMTPQLQKRRDGLAPSLLTTTTRASGDPKASITKSYQTSSKFLNKNVLNKEVDDSGEFEIIVNSITSTLKELVKASDPPSISSMVFQAVGCKWILELEPSLNADRFCIEVVCSACEEAQKYGNTYLVDSSIISKDGKDVAIDERLKGLKDASDYIGLQVRKAVVRCEFPEFPEGCKDQTFREVYQLNARVSTFVRGAEVFTHSDPFLLSLYIFSAQVGFLRYCLPRNSSCFGQKSSY